MNRLPLRKRLRLSLLATILALACLLVWAMPAAAIQFGQYDPGHPYVCMVQFSPTWRTTGVLLSPRVVLTAGHGTYGYATAKVWFSATIPTDASGAPDPSAASTGKCFTDPNYALGYDDVGIVLLDRKAPVGDFGRLPAPGFDDTLPMMHPIDLVGYGANYQDHAGGATGLSAWQWLNKRYYAPSQLIDSKNGMSAGFLQYSANPANGKGTIVFGDSGGPVLDAGANLVLAVNTYVMNYNCMGISYGQRVDIPRIQDWIAGFLK